MKNTKKIGVLISLLLISIIALGAVSAADDVAVDDADVAAVDEVVVDDAPITDDIDFESADIVVTDTGDSADLDDTDDVISDAGLEGDSDDGDAVVSDASSPKSALKAEPLGAPEDDPVGTFHDLWTLINNAPSGSTINLQQNYAYNPSTDTGYYTTISNGWTSTRIYYTDGMVIYGKTLTINGQGHFISGSNGARIFDVWTGTLNLKNLTLKEGNARNSETYNAYGGAIYVHGNGATLNVDYCNLTDNHADGNSRLYSGGVVYTAGTTTITNSILVNNSAYNGGAFTIADGTFNIHGCLIFNNTATNSSGISPTFGDNGWQGGSGSGDYEYNWWGSNKGPEDTVATERVNTARSIHDWFILTETLSSPITIDVDFELYRGGTCDYTIPARLITVTHDALTCNTTSAWCPAPFVIEFTTADDAYINVSTDYEQQHLKVFGGENKKNITYLYVEVDDVTLPDQPVAHVYTDIDGHYNLTLGTEVFDVNVENGHGTYQFTDLGVGQYSVIVSRVDDPVYKTTFNTTDFEVKRFLNTLTISLETSNPTYGQDVTVGHEFTLPEGAIGNPSGTITYFVDGATAGTELDVGDDFVLSGLSAGSHSVYAKYGGDGTYGESTSNTLTFTVAQAALEINVTDVTVHYPNKGTVNVKANVDGKYTIKVKDTNYEVTIVDGVGSFDVTEDLVAGTYAISWNIPESENYTAASGSAVYEVLRTEPTFNISGSDEINYNTTNTITPSINSDATGTITYKINGTDAGSAGVKEGFVTPILDVGTYKVTATYSGDDNYEGATAEFEFEVVPMDIIVTVENSDVVYPRTTFVSISASVPGTYTITINGKTYTAVVDEDGDGIVDVTDAFPVGVYDISVTADIGDNYNPVNIPSAATYTVTKAQSTIAVSYNDGTFTVTLDGVNGEKLNETFHITVDNEDCENGETENGKFIFTKEDVGAYVELGPGKHNIFVIFDGNDNYLGDYAQTSFDIPKKPASEVDVTITPSKDAYEYGENVILDITVKDKETGAGLTGPVTVTVDGIDYAITVTNGVGQATVKGLENGTFAAEAKFLGNDEYEEASATPATVVVKASTKITITASSEPVTYGENSFIEVAVVDGAGNPVEVDTVNVTISGETKEYAVADGKVDLGKLDAAQYTAVVSYVDETYELASAVATVLVNPAVSELTLTSGEGTVTIAAKDKDGNALTGTAFVVIDGEEPIEVQVAEDGTEYTLNVAPGARTVDVTFNKENYLPSTGTVVVTVPKYVAELSIAADNTTPTFGTDVTITATLTEGATGTITYFVDGATTGTEVAIGESFVLSGLSAGEHTVVAKYGGDNNYSEATSNEVTITVAKASLSIFVEQVTVTYPNKGTVTVEANVDGKYTIKVNDKEYEVNVIGGTGSFEVSEVLDAGIYFIYWHVPTTENYTGAFGNAPYVVKAAAPEFSISGNEEINYGQTNTITPTINSDATGTVSYKINGSDAGSADVKEGFVTEALPAGHYTVVANYSGDTNYGEAIAEFEFDVLPIDVEVTVENVQVVYPNTGTVTVTASVPGTYNVTINKKDYEVTVGEEGTGSVAVTDVFDVGKYDISVTADLGGNYKPVSIGSAATYTVTKAQSAMAITYADGTFTVTLDGVDEKLSETYHIILDNAAYGDDATVDGVDTFTIADLGPGKHGVFVIFDGNDNYLGTYAQTSVDIPKKTGAVVTVTAPDIKEGQNATITVTVKDGEIGLTGVVTVTLDETDYALDVIDGTGTLIVQNLVSKDSPAVNNTTYAIVAKFNGNDEYEPATGEGSQLVQDWNPVIIVISSAGETAFATLVDTDLNNITGKVMVTIDDGDAKEHDCIDGKVTIDDITEGEHTVTVYFAGDDTHPEASETATVDIGKKLIPVNLVLSLADIKYGEDATAVVSLTAKDPELGNIVRLSGKVNVTVGDQTKEVTVTDGEGQIKFSGLNANSYVAIAEFLGDDTYDYSMVTAPVTVKQLKTRIVARNMTTTAINVTEDGRIGQYFSWTLVDEKGNVLANKPVSIGFNANVYNRVTNSSGQARLQINLQNSGPYTFAISFLGDENYEGCFEVVKIDVNKQKAQLTSASKTYKASAATKTLTATYKTKAGKAIVGKTIKFTVNGKTYSAKTDANGVAKVNVSLNKAGTYSVEVKATETNTYAENIKTITLKLT